MDFKTEILKCFDSYSNEKFEDLAFELFKYQSKSNKVYQKYLSLLSLETYLPSSLDDIPLMPISFFKHYEVQTGDWTAEKIFLSSGTTSNQLRSQHLVKDAEWYKTISSKTFQNYYSLKDSIWALLPSYLENGDSSLVFMFKNLIQDDSRFHLYDFDVLKKNIIHELQTTENQVVLCGVTFALLDMALTASIDNPRLKILFTGGMKNRGKELSFSEVVTRLQAGFPSSAIAAEYGMTEMFSQAYAQENGRYEISPTMNVSIKDVNDPLTSIKHGKQGQLGIIDLANVDTLAFFLSDDQGVKYSDNTFEVRGRLSNSDLRGCTQMYEMT